MQNKPKKTKNSKSKENRTNEGIFLKKYICIYIIGIGKNNHAEYFKVLLFCIEKKIIVSYCYIILI